MLLDLFVHCVCFVKSAMQHSYLCVLTNKNCLKYADHWTGKIVLFACFVRDDFIYVFSFLHVCLYTLCSLSRLKLPMFCFPGLRIDLHVLRLYLILCWPLVHFLI